MCLKMTNDNIEQADRMFNTMDMDDFNQWLYKKINISYEEKEKEFFKNEFASM